MGELLLAPPALSSALGLTTFISEYETLYVLGFSGVECLSLVEATLVTLLTGWEEFEALPTGITAVSELVLLTGDGTVCSRALAPVVSELRNIFISLLGVMSDCIFLTFSVLLNTEHTMGLNG
jgi:hypothetical protein